MERYRTVAMNASPTLQDLIVVAAKDGIPFEAVVEIERTIVTFHWYQSED